MRSVIQLVKNASVKIDEKVVASIEKGIVALIGFEKSDDLIAGEKLIRRILNYRIFPDSNNRMNLSLLDIQGDFLLVPQFTLVAETNKGTRPGFSIGMPPAEGSTFFAEVLKLVKSLYPKTHAGEFGANMQVSLCNDGPVTFILST